MAAGLKKIIDNFGLPRIIISSFLIILLIIAVSLNLSISSLLSDTLVRTGMNGILVLSMLPGIICGIGMNFGLPIGILCGLLGGMISIELNLTGFVGFLAAIAISIPAAILAGYIYGILLNKVKGSEMMVATYTGFAVVFLFCIGWLITPFRNPQIVWVMGKGLRTTISVEELYSKILDNFGAFEIYNMKIPVGLLLFFLFFCLIMWLFLRSKTGIEMKIAGSNPKFAVTCGINVDRYRILGTVLSTVLGAIGIIVYSQSYGFYQLYQAPMMMGFTAISAILIGGATATTAKIGHVILGTFLFQGLLTVAMPVANEIVTEGNLSEVVRIVVSNGIILYALTKVNGGGKNE